MLGLKQGDTGDDVRLMQIMIYDLNSTAMRADGDIGKSLDSVWGPATTEGLGKVIGTSISHDSLGVWQWRRLVTYWTRHVNPPGEAAAVDLAVLDKRYVNEATATVVDKD